MKPKINKRRAARTLLYVVIIIITIIIYYMFRPLLAIIRYSQIQKI